MFASRRVSAQVRRCHRQTRLAAQRPSVRAACAGPRNRTLTPPPWRSTAAVRPSVRPPRNRGVGHWAAALINFPSTQQWAEADVDLFMVMLRLFLLRHPSSSSPASSSNGDGRVVAGPAYAIVCARTGLRRRLTRHGPSSGPCGPPDLLWLRSRRIEVDWHLISDPTDPTDEPPWQPTLSEFDYLQVGPVAAADGAPVQSSPDLVRVPAVPLSAADP